MGMMLLLENHWSAFFEVCFGSLSCWKYPLSLALSKLSMLSSTPSSKISQYCTASMFPCTFISFPTPFQPIHPQTIKLFSPPCLTVGVVGLSDTGSPCCFQTYTFQSDPILLIFVSSVHNTLFQTSKVHFSWYCVR